MSLPPSGTRPAATREVDMMRCRACGREDRASEGYPCDGCGTFICLPCTIRGTTLCRECQHRNPPS